MSNVNENTLNEEVKWEGVIHQLTHTDIVEGGGGSDRANLQAQQLANRTQYLKKNIADTAALLTEDITNLTTKLNNKITYGTDALTPGTSTLATGNVYLRYE